MEICVSLSAISRYSSNISSWYMLTNVSPRYMLTQPDRFDVALLHLDRPVFYQVLFALPSLVDIHQVPVHQLCLFVWLHFLDSTVLQDNIIPVCLPPGDISLSGKILRLHTLYLVNTLWYTSFQAFHFFLSWSFLSSFLLVNSTSPLHLYISVINR